MRGAHRPLAHLAGIQLRNSRHRMHSKRLEMQLPRPKWTKVPPPTPKLHPLTLARRQNWLEKWTSCLASLVLHRIRLLHFLMLHPRLWTHPLLFRTQALPSHSRIHRLRSLVSQVRPRACPRRLWQLQFSGPDRERDRPKKTRGSPRDVRRSRCRRPSQVLRPLSAPTRHALYRPPLAPQPRLGT